MPAEIRDYFSDKQMGVITNTVRLGLTKATALGIELLTIGGTLAGAGLTLYFAQTTFPWLAIFVLVMGVGYAHILCKYWRLYRLAEQHVRAVSEKQQELAKSIVKISSENPKWITMVTQLIMLICAVLLVSKFL